MLPWGYKMPAPGLPLHAASRCAAGSFMWIPGISSSRPRPSHTYVKGSSRWAVCGGWWATWERITVQEETYIVVAQGTREPDDADLIPPATQSLQCRDGGLAAGTRRQGLRQHNRIQLPANARVAERLHGSTSLVYRETRQPLA
ncbi:hypothetical protein MAPG_09151 [Magnaporthiopsis poae ATCC 64411]|uniref:Uncharacterized protein n=1 Tax=Magnaporthiopsis poae (strain ATCC 64411 / 73-15) TaxID=644358 RepID=A0A0C4E972_MAGP6|nr:hypothetical protein MAPG_09151 [Magnaporthiopsis poae ATCC 64411]